MRGVFLVFLFSFFTVQASSALVASSTWAVGAVPQVSPATAKKGFYKLEHSTGCEEGRGAKVGSVHVAPTHALSC